MDARTRNRTTVALGLVAALAAAAIAWWLLVPLRTPTGQPPLTVLASDSLPTFRSAFDACGNEVCILALFSPT
jgi:hypothetical protein